MKMSKKFLIIASILSIAIGFLLGRFMNKAKYKTISGPTMGTSFLIKFYHDQKIHKSLQDLEKGIKEHLLAVNKTFSTYRPDSEISKLNQDPHSHWVSVSPLMIKVMSHALNVSALSHGAFDPTLGPLVNLWGFGPDGERKRPSDQALSSARIKVGHGLISLNPGKLLLKREVKGMYLDFSASAKGLGVDIIGEYLKANKIEHFMVEIGGEVKVLGQGPQGAWKIGLESPVLSKNSKKIMTLKDLSVATSGSYRNFFEEKGIQYSHTIDPLTGKPIRHGMVLASVLSDKSCMDADAWATALMAMGPKDAMRISEKLGLRSYLVFTMNLTGKVEEKDLEFYLSKAFKKSVGDFK